MDVSVWTRGQDLIIKPHKDLEILDKLQWMKKDKKGLYHTQPIYFPKIEKLFDCNIYFEDDPIWTAQIDTELSIAPRPYQKEAHDLWMKEKRGYIVLVTGAGKTIQALIAMDALKTSTLIVVPTIDLLNQWKESIEDNLGVSDVGVLGGGKKDIRPVTVTTYDSARIYLTKLSKFKFVVFDELHHLPAEQNRTIALGMIAPFRLGLTATPERTDGLHEDLDFLVGPQLYRKGHEELQDYIADFEIKRIFVPLSQKEKWEYEQSMKTYKSYIKRKRLYRYGKNAYKQIIYRAGRDPAARQALLSHQDARKTALNAGGKVGRVLELLKQHREDKVLIFSEYNDIVDEISERYLIPSITHKTKAHERREILEKFKKGEFTKLVTGRVLDEGVDVPDANIGIIVSGTASERSYIQRLGRILRPKKETAILYELISTGTTEVNTSRRRRL